MGPFRATSMTARSALPCRIEIPQVRRRLILAARHQAAVGAEEIGFAADIDVLAVGVLARMLEPLGVAPAGLLLAAISGAIATGFGYVVWYFAVRDLPVTHAASAQLSMPALVALGGAAFLSEPITARLLVASLAMLGGIALVLGRRRELPSA